MNLIFQTWAHIKKDLLIYETPLAQIKDNKMKKHYYDPSKYGTYLEQLGVKYPTIKK